MRRRSRLSHDLTDDFSNGPERRMCGASGDGFTNAKLIHLFWN